MAKIFITRKIPEKAREMLEGAGHEVAVGEWKEAPSKSQIIEAVSGKGFEAAITLLTDKIDAEVFEALPEVKLYANYATGFDNIDTEEAKKREIVVTNAPTESSSVAVAGHALALLLSLQMKIVEADQFVRDGKYKGWEAMNFVGMGIKGKVLGIVGTGKIGSELAKYASSIGFQIAYYDVKRDENIEKETGAKFYQSLEELLKVADAVSLHVPLLPTTKHLINMEKLRMMKPEAFLINTSRGGVVNEEDLARALEEKIISGAGLDVFEKEPEVNAKLLKMQNVILTPHIASATHEARDEMAEVVANNVLDFLSGKSPRNQVN